MGYTPHVLVVGGGATGTAVARDLAMRGLEVTLVERGTLASGTSGSMQALLHSGARQAATDPALAAVCRQENAIVRDIAGHAVTETGGLVASLPADPDGYLATKLAACEAVEIETRTLSGEAARERESTLVEDVERAIAVPDAVVDPVRLCVATARSAVRHGARVQTGTRVTDIETDGDAVGTVRLSNEDPDVSWLSDEKVEVLDPDYVVNAAGPWAGAIAGMVDLDVPIGHTQGAMLVTAGGGLETAVHRCRPPTDGDLAVPFGATTVLGTTDREIGGPDDVQRHDDAVDVLVDELDAVVPSVVRGRPYRAYWGVRARPPQAGVEGCEIAGGSAVRLDHEARDGCWGITTVYGGNVTIARYVAEQVTDQVCATFGIDRPCRTATTPLPAGPDPASVGAVDSTTDDAPTEPPAVDPVVCPCGGVRESQIRAVMADEELPAGHDLAAVVKRTRAGMGACQGGRCAHRIAACLAPDRSRSAVDGAFASLATGRWAGRRFALWGEQFVSAARTYQLHAGVMNRGGRPGPTDDPIEFGAFDEGQEDGRGQPPDGSPVQPSDRGQSVDGIADEDRQGGGRRDD